MANLPENMIAGLKNDSVAVIDDFMNLCGELNGIIKRENELILATGTSVTDGEFHYKLQLMSSFEERSQYVFKLVAAEAPSNKWLHLYIVSEVSGLRQSFKINTALHMDDLQRRAKKLMRMRDGLLASTLEPETEGEAPACH
ncbi:MAG: hypothetical protein PW788_03570 [Micavibrio sp.]|nr:hypothetical protein [Micavibrio sp.]